jgi:pSer/pThr/pTyr-binding forkhead associated (FHA) protein/anti-anti-sigma regulatory factor
VKLKVSVRSPQGDVRTLEFEKTAVSIGRGAKNDLVIQDTIVSTSHASFIFNPRRGIYELVDMGSTNGTFVDGRRIDTSVPIDRPHIVVLGAYQLLVYPPEEGPEKGTVVMDLSMLPSEEVERSEARPAKAVPAPEEPPEVAATKTRPSRIFVSEPPDAPSLTLEFLEGQYAGKTMKHSVQKNGIVFGRDVACHVIFKDPHISRNHFAIHKGNGGFYLANLKENNPSTVDGNLLTGGSAWLRNGSVVECHNEKLRVRWEEEKPVPEPEPPAPAADSLPAGELAIEERGLGQGIRMYLLKGDVNINNYYKLENLLLANLSPVQKWAVVDLAQVRTLDYPALASIIKVLAEYTKIKGLLSFIRVSPALIQIFQLVNVDRYLKKFVFVDEEEAVQALLKSRRG